MDFGCWTSLIRFLLLYRAVKSALIPDGVHRTECHDRYLMIAVDLSFAGQEPYFEAVDRTGVFHITDQYAAMCGYTVTFLTELGLVELRASYFSCHTANKNDHTFTFNFNLIETRADKRNSYEFNKTCSPSLPWSPREVTCEENYLEVSVKSDVMCPFGTKVDDWDSVMQMLHVSATPAWQVVFVKEGKEMKPLNLSEAHSKGYTFSMTENRLLFRAPYGLSHSFTTVIDGISVEVAHAVLFSRQEWVVLIVDLIASCTMYEAPDENNGFVMWETPFTLYPGLRAFNCTFGLNGELWKPIVQKHRGYNVTNNNTTLIIGIPYDADGAYRKSVVNGDLYDLYTYHFYMEQKATSNTGAETRTRTFRKLSSPPLKRHLLTEDRTVPQNETFTVYFGNVPGDLELVALQLNEKEFNAPFGNQSSHTLDIALFENNTYGFTLKVPFDNPLVIKKFSAENAATENKLNIIYTLLVRPKGEPYSYYITVMALTAVSPPQFNVSCSESGITFELEHKPSDVLWDIIVSSDLLTSELATRQGYIMTNNSQTLKLHVPLFTHGYKYEQITLDGFKGTFETYVRNHKTLEVQSSTVKTCPFTAKEIVLCSKDGMMTFIADLSEAVQRGGNPVKTSLLNVYCTPVEADGTRALFSFPLNSCGTRVEFDYMSVIYKNEILFSMNDTAQIGSISVECMYPLASLHYLFSMFKFLSKTAGIGRIVRALPSAFFGDYAKLQSSTPIISTKPPTISPTMKLAVRPAMKPIMKSMTSTTEQREKPLAYRPPVQYVSVLSYSKQIKNGGRYKRSIDK